MMGPHHSIIWRLISIGQGAAACKAVCKERRRTGVVPQGKLQHSHKHRRHPLSTIDLLTFDDGEGTFRIEALHDEHRAAKRKTVIEWRSGAA